MSITKVKSIVFCESAKKINVPGETVFHKTFPLVLTVVCCGLLCLANFADAADPPTVDSQMGDTVINPLIEPADPPTAPPNNETTVTGLDMSLADGDPLDYTQFVFSGVSGTPGDNEYSFMVRGIDEKIYSFFDGILYEYTITSIVNSPTPYTSPLVTISREVDGETETADFDAWQTYNQWLSMFAVNTEPTPPDDSFGSGGLNGVSYVRYGSNGGNGHGGALFVPPGDGKPGGTGPSFTFQTLVLPNPPLGLNVPPYPPLFPIYAINAVNKVGLFVASIGGKGGNGGWCVACPYSGGDGANGGKGGNVTLLNNTPTTITTSGNKSGSHGIYVLSRSGQGGSGGSGYGAPGGGTGGGSLDGGNVTIVNGIGGNIQTDSPHSYGILGLSASGTGGSGGDQYGIWGDAGDGGGAANGGDVKITNAGGTIITKQEGSFGIIAQSIGGTGGSSGDSGNLIYSGDANAKNGGNGGKATIINEGQVFTEGINSQGLAAQSIGGGGGNSGSSWGLVAIGGTADDGGTGDAVSVTNTSTGLVQTLGDGSIGIFAQSVGGSGGRGGDAGGLVAIGGSGAIGGAGGTVNVTNTGVVKTFGNGSRGIFAESVGGGGGSGGSTGGMVSVGGTGAGGGDGNNVTVVQSGTITTAGDYSEGIYAQSVGGGGGDGGTSTAVGVFAAVGIGGDGGKGGDGGEVDIILGGDSPSIIKTGNDEDGGYKSVGLFAQSVGGGGGTGGGAMAASFGLYASVSVALGGDGGTGGDGGKVNLTTPLGSQDTIVSTRGDHSTGIYLQSVGGGGGDGGYAYSMAAAAGDVGSLTVNVGIGGDGNAGGKGGEVTVGSGFTANPTIDDLPILPTSGFNGSIFTDGERSTGLFAQSVGGGGGNGGLAISAGVSASAGASLGISVGLGGDGGAAGDGGLVKVATEGDITTNQAQSTALLVQSVGGGGGNGGGTVAAGVAASGGAAASINVGGGGEGAAGGKGGEVILVTGEGNILTKGTRLPDPELDPVLDAELLARIEGGQSPGIIVQSVGGGGGNGGYAVAAGVAGAGAAAGGVTVGLGGGGGAGGDGGKVFAQMASNVTTKGDSSPAILAQSVGGGGGNGGFSVSVAGGGAGTAAGAVSVGLGGEGAVGGKGGEVIASSSGEILTEGFQSAGFTAQSIGGGGGNGGFNVSLAGAGSGAGAGAVSVGLGGSAGEGQDSGLVSALSSGSVSTRGDDSIGVLAQSIGGGGGNGGFNVSASGAGAGAGSGAVSVGLGGSGAAGGDGNTVSLTVQNDVSTEGASSTAVVAQSIGGGGGNGGFNVSASASGAGTGSGAVSVGLGGSGSSGGKGGTVAVSASGDIVTMGADSAGILAQSVGGGGGNGGFNIAASLSGAGTASGGVAVGLGGDGGSGGFGGDVNASSSGTITTLKNNSAAFIAQSIGGGGGSGGFNVSGSLSGAGTASGSVNVGLGGGGGIGSDSGTVTGLVTGKIWTHGLQSTGVLAQSVGGGGGNGGFNVSAGGSGAGTGSGTVSVGLGGDGSGGGKGGLVNLTVTETVYTRGAQSGAVIAQSIGGGGGNGGFNVSAAASGAGTGSGTVGVGLGGSGAGGGDGGTVILATKGNILTMGAGSGGILAQSVGGGGGNGGFNVSVSGSGAGTGSGAVAVGLGGSGAGGGNASTVNLTVTNNVTTTRKDSSGIVAQSIGGGGGNGGFNVSVSGSGAKTGSGAVSVGLGGSGGTGGFAGNVTSRVRGDIVTGGKNSTGLLVQSIGGGGGNGGFSVSAAISGAGTGSGTAAVGLGGSGGGGGVSGKVKSTLTGDVTTSGKNAAAVIAQSIGGGGGNGGLTVAGAISAAKTGSGAASVSIGGSGGGGGNASTVDNTVTGNIVTYQSDSSGVLAQSLGGGGGNGGISISGTISAASTGSGAVSVGIGGSGGEGGNSSKVTNKVTGTVYTSGSDASGIAAQSLGGGGGNGGINVSGAISAAKTGSGALGVGIGGSGGGGGDGGEVDNTVDGLVQTLGDNSTGILAQSLGGGGGNGGLNVSGTISAAKSGSGALSVGIGGSGGDGGYSSKVTNRVTGTVYTSGSDASGIAAQSLGGGGGNGGINITGSISAAKTGAGALGVGIGGSGGGGGNAGEVDNTVEGYVQTLGDNSTGILAQSLGGGGGNGGLNVTGTITAAKKFSGGLAIGVGGFGGDGGNAADVTNMVTGGTVTTGNNADGIVAQSLGGGGGNGAINVSGSVNISKENGGTLGVGIGGFGGNGGNAGDVISTMNTTVAYNQIGTTGNDSSAVIAQSIGGGGGNGGLNVTGAVNATGKNGAAIGIGVGGFGGGAGNAGNVSLGVTGPVVTEGNNSHGLVAQSIGGGGGNGGTNVTGSLAITKPAKGTSATTVAASIGIGGFGGGGGKAGNVDVDYTGTIVAQPRVLVSETVDPDSGETIPEHYEFREGVGSHGILAQSLGGGGGNGGLNVSAGVSYAAKKGDGHALLVGVGGFGGIGGHAGSVDVTVEGGESVSAYGAGHSAVMAQSAGGGGGNGGLNVSGGIVSDSALIVGVGGMGGNGGMGRDVTVNATTDVYASAADSRNLNSAGILAQSLGGGGGNGGLNVSGGLSLSKEKDVPSITVGVGGFGGSGAVSGDVDVDHTGLAMTSGNWIHGIMAQSIGGGGGNGALNVSGQINWADSKKSGGETDLTIVAGIGGHGGAGANAGDVAVASTGTITTAGDHARGIFAQSIGGGGGNGGMNVTGVFAKNSSPVSIGVGGFGSGGGNAGEVSVTRGSAALSAGLISTDGVGAMGIEASSIGGGGGDAGMNFIVGISLAGSKKKGKTRKHPKHTGVDESVFKNFDKVLDELENTFPKDDQDKKDDSKDSAFAAQIAIGGAGGEAGHGDAVTVENFGDIITKQNSSHGIMGQSIGGGGGNANLNVAVTYQGKSDKNKGFNLAIGGAPGDGGYGGRVDVNHDGFIETMGDNSYGVLSQSIGGGGGNAGLDFAYSKSGGKIGITLGRRGGTGGYGDDVTLSSKGSVITHGNSSFGLLAQSIGNGGGNSSATSFSIATPGGDDSPSRAASISVGLEGGEGGAGGNVSLGAAGWVSTDGENAHAIFAQSVGGGGGNGGSASGYAFLSSTAALSIGGTGGKGGIGGTVKVASSADVRTNNRDSVGILAQSVGGGGGTGGMVKSGGLQTRGSGALVSIGGAGGAGMAGGEATVDNSGVVITDGVNSHGVLAQSLGGGGGNSGMVINTIYNKDASKATQISVSVGGSGGDGAVSKTVKVTNTGGIGTNQENSIGIFAQSVGGGGGNASTVVTGSISGKGAGNKISVGIGGSGGTGGAAGNVTVANLKDESADSGKIITQGNYSHGILAMSVGGGGGTGSTTITSNKTGAGEAKSSSYSVAFSLGGAGGDGGTGGKVAVTNNGEIATYGYKAHGISALSVGGGGGSGGMSIAGDLSKGGTSKEDAKNKASNISIGGFGGSGNTSGDVTVHNSGSIEVFGDRSYGIYAQSVGGGGGDGGFSSTLSRNLITNPKSNLKLSSLLNIGMGGSGGNGADSGNVLVEHTGSVTAHGDNSFGIFAQSVGGGGGNVGSSITNPAWMAVDYAVSNLLGAREGSRGKAGTVTVNTTGDIVMLGANSQAQFAQSVNGGGGNMDFFLDVSQQAVELGDDGFELPDNSGDVDKAIAFVKQKIKLGTTAIKDAVGSAIGATHVGDLYTAGKESIASLIQSIGGGGGSENAEIVVDSQANVDLVLALGGAESSNSSGGNVKLTREGDIGTSGDKSQGAGVQSIGGGGGNLTVNVRKVPVPEVPVNVVASSTPVPFATLAAPMTEASESSGSSTAKVMLGSDAGENNDGGDMDLTYTGDLTTEGDLSAGLIIQSIGGGGGQLHLTGLDSLEISIGASGNSSGNGGNVAVTNEGTISTEGELSHGIMIQSIGGGGGAAFTDLDESAVNLILNSDNSGDGGTIDFEQTGDIVVSGDRAIGVFAQSLGGGGGVVDRLFADTAGGAGSSGDITLGLDGDIQALGQEGVAVFAQSRSAEAQGNINVTLSAGKRLNFGAGGTGVWFSGGADNSFVNNGIAAGEDGILGWVVLGEEGDEVVENHSTFLGQFDLGPGVNSFINHSAQIFVPGPMLSLGDASCLLTQNGVMMPGDMLHAQHTELTGSFLQTATGLTFAELDFNSDNPNVDGGLIDSFFATGTIDLAGELNLSLVNPQLVPYGSFQKTLFQGDMGLVDHGVALTTVPSVVIKYDLVFPGSDAAALDYSVDFSPEGMGNNLTQLGDYFNRIQAAGSSPELADAVVKLLYEPDMEIYSESLSQLSPEFYGELQVEQLRRSQRFTEVLADGGEYRFVKKDRVVWFQFEKETNEQDASGDLKGAKHHTNRYAVGMQKKFNDKWTAGIGLSIEDNESDSNEDQWTSNGDAFYLGASLKREFGSTQFLAGISYGWAESDVERRGEITESFLAKADRDYKISGGLLRASRTFYKGRAYFRPIFDLGLTHLKADNASEKGADGLNLEIEDYSETYTWMRPATGLGYQHHFNNGWKMKMRGGLGFHYYFSEAETEVSAGFAGAPVDVEPMDVLVDFDQSYALGAIGVEILTSRDLSLGLYYNKIIGDRSDLDRLSVALKVPF